MNTEQKAIAYDEVREKIALRFGSNVAEEIFSEFEESEDDRIRKGIISTLKFANHKGVYDKYIAWLEKQGEQKPFDYESANIKQKDFASKNKPKFNVGDWVVLSTSDGEKVVQIDSIEYFKSGEPRYITSEGRWFGNGTKARLLTDKDMETITLPESKIIVKQKPAWSEEDEVKINRIVACLENLNVADNDILLKDVDWLKSLKDRYTWKPSDEQIHAFEQIYDWYNNDFAPSETLTSLYNDLKKLSE